MGARVCVPWTDIKEMQEQRSIMELLRRIYVFMDSPPSMGHDFGMRRATEGRAAHRRLVICLVFFTVCSACAKFTPEPPAPSAGHLSRSADTSLSGDIPEIVTQPPPVPEPAPLQHEERYTVVVNGVPVTELLFALARDAQVNVDIAPGISGLVTMNAVEQTLPQLLQRIARQAGLRSFDRKRQRIHRPGRAVFPHLPD